MSNITFENVCKNLKIIFVECGFLNGKNMVAGTFLFFDKDYKQKPKESCCHFSR